MKPGILILVVLLLTSIRSPAQNIHAGLSLGWSTVNAAEILTDSVVIQSGNIYSKYLMPSLGLELRREKKMSIWIGLEYRKTTLSMTGWNLRGDTCALCPLKKGGGPSSKEIRLNPGLRWKLNPSGKLRISLYGGIGISFRFQRTSNQETVPDDPVASYFSSATSVYHPIQLSYQFGAGLSFERISLFLFHEYTPKFAGTFTTENHIFPFRVAESMIRFQALFNILRLKK